ncbi:MAG: protein-L-isoaspartate(D-aspartate) O-methyltransferase [Candidatus Krumholzibacteriota bacterium]|nr:protein-L-isoaspartate(D-aspartate) O-methyltransferase [Candidatus Krumholzibacteriota bacterium]
MIKGHREDRDTLRRNMVHSQIVARGIKDKKVIEAMIRVPREILADTDDPAAAFYDGPLTIGYGQTISQPYIVAYMTEQLELSGNEKVLEIGTGSGYQSAVLAELAREVYSVEIIEELSRAARSRLADLGYKNIHCRCGDGASGWPEEAPFDAIIITAAPTEIPWSIASQLTEAGRMILPVGDSIQQLQRVTRSEDGFRVEDLIGVRFVPMTGGSRETEL